MLANSRRFVLVFMVSYGIREFCIILGFFPSSIAFLRQSCLWFIAQPENCLVSDILLGFFATAILHKRGL